MIANEKLQKTEVCKLSFHILKHYPSQWAVFISTAVYWKTRNNISQLLKGISLGVL